MSLTFGEDGELITSNESEPSTWEISGASTAVIHCFAQAHALVRLPMHADELLALPLNTHDETMPLMKSYYFTHTQAHELTFSRFRLELESREFVISNSGNASTDNAVLHRGYLKH
jgi:hypothetical protein